MPGFTLHFLAANLAVLLSLAFCSTASAGKFNAVLSPGDKAPDFSDLEGVDGKKHSLQEVADADAVVIVFTCNSCPYAVDLEDRLIQLAKDLGTSGKKCAVIAIGSNTIPADSLEAMTVKAKEKGFPFWYLYDATQKVAKDFGATRTPEVFVLNKERKLVYQGMFDNSPDGKSVTAKYVEQAVNDTLAGKIPATQETAPVGCLIRFAKNRGDRGKSK